MKKSIILFVLLLLAESSILKAQDSFPNGKALNIPFRKYGLSIGNSYEFTGIRFNFSDKNIKRVNGLNVTLWIDNFRFSESNASFKGKVNGISLGVINVGNTLHPLNLGLIATGAGNNLSGLSIGGLFVGAGNNLNGISLSGLFNETGGNINGINISGLWTEARVISGIAISGFVMGAEKTNGIAFGGVGIGSEVTNGISASIVYLNCSGEFRGLGITPGYLDVSTLCGVALAGYSNTNKLSGISVALYNRCDDLHGVQFGLLNYAGNNRKPFRMLPFINFNL